MYLFSPSSVQSNRELIFKTTPLGKLRETLPLLDLATLLPVKENPEGAKAWFSREGMLALMFLKSYVGVSDASLIEQLNGNWHMQFFCGMQLADTEQIKDESIVSRIRTYLGEYLDLSILQKELISSWKIDMNQTHINMQDATVYESYIKFPTDVKLLWDCCEFLEDFYRDLYQCVKLKKGKHSFENQKKKQRTYNLLRRKSRKKTRRRRSQLLKLLARLKSLIDPILERFGPLLNLSEKRIERYKTAQQIMSQQRFLHENPSGKLPDRIVSLYKPYIRPIVRGKENKSVEFGVKVHMMQVDGINIVEHYSYDAYNECKRVKPAIELHKELFGEVKQVAADRIYATNENRTFLKEEKIAHNFVPKGKGDTPQKKQLRDGLNRGRSTVLEGSFGNEKNHYGLHKIKARNQANETLWVFFGIMTANAVKMIKKRANKDRPPAKKAA